MLVKAEDRSKAELAQVAPEKLHQCDGCHRRRFGAENAPTEMNELEILPSGVFGFLCRKTAFRPDGEQHGFGGGLLSITFIQRLMLLLFPKQQLECPRP